MPRVAFLIIGLAWTQAGCGSFRERPTVQFGFTIGYGETVAVEPGVDLTLLDVLEDTRCPSAQGCGTPGNVRLEFRVQFQNGQRRTVVIDTGFGTPQQPLDEHFLLRVEGVRPNRTEDRPIPKTDYRVVVEVVPI